MNTHRPMIDDLESRMLMSATIETSTDAGEVPPAQYASSTPGPDDAPAPRLSAPLTYKLVYNRAS